jgi:hypothetical protein
MCVGLVNAELQGHERNWMNSNLWYLATETEERHNDSLCKFGLCRGTAIDSTLILIVLQSNEERSIL